MIEIVPARELGEGYRRPITEVFVDAFGRDFAYFSDDPRRLADAFEHMLVLDVFHVALLDGEPAGIAACTDGRQLSLVPQGRHLRRHLGLVKGTIGAIALKREFSGGVPDIADGAASIEVVGTASRFQGKGVATALITHFLALPQYREYVLETVSDINTPALNLYRKLGFVEYKRVRVRHTKLSGISYYVSLKLTQD
ncbi:acetyltransferase (GNAT) family protein [Pseudonocardia hierapolitana]|uniref:Acetyltransferase (GNAT) family protein n=1 Tax=Pseudonocardia hierapolitana TaxID=1128676 RepID=A0A561SX58_9PSEU|nr:GNAT family N-acetyltransferase [Pseudonocardia hierapolitana]TWF79452.1 acetyltransferase (GNAT) family protein [Pseudonocardia hierapolitana]